MLEIKCSEYNQVITDIFKKIFVDSIKFGFDKKSFKIKITTKSHLAILENILSRKKISAISVIFVTNGLNFSKLNAYNFPSEEEKYKQKLCKSYKVLGIGKDSTDKEIKNNYKKMLRKYHPDRVYNKGTETIELYTKRFQVIQESYKMVKQHLSL